MVFRTTNSRWSVLKWLLKNKKLYITLALLALYRLLTFVPLPGVDSFLLEELASDPGSPDLVTGFLNLLSGGGFSRLSILALGVSPMILARGFLNAFIPFVPRLERIMQDDPREGRRIFTRWTTILVAPASVLQAIVLFYSIQSTCSFGLFPRFRFNSGLLSTIVIFVSLTLGAYLALGIAKLIGKAWNSNSTNDEYPTVFGLNAMIFSGASLVFIEEIYKVWRVAAAVGDYSLQATHWLGVGVYLAGLLSGLVMMAFFVGGKRNIPVQYPRRIDVPRKSVPNLASLPIYLRSTWNDTLEAQAVLSTPLFFFSILACSPPGALQKAGAAVVAAVQPDSPWSGPLLFLSVVLFGPVLATLHFNEENYAETLRRVGGQIPGLRGWDATQVYLNRIFLRVSIGAAVMTGIILLIPWIVNITFGLDALLLAGEALFLLVAFTRDLVYKLSAEYHLDSYQTRSLIR